MAQVNIKPNRIKFIKALEASIKRIEKEHDDYNAAIKQFDKDLAAWRKTADLSPENIKSSEVSTHYHNGTPQSVTVVLKKYPPNQPKKPTEPSLAGYRKTEAIEDLRSVIAMLKLTDEETVNASVANRVAKYL